MAVILGVSGAFKHDPSACVLIDGKLAAAADEERFIRIKHASRKYPVNAVKFCLEKAGINPQDVQHVAYPWSPVNYKEKRWRYLRRMAASRPSRLIKEITRPNLAYQKRAEHLQKTLQLAGINPSSPKIHLVEHHLAHASSGYHLSGFENAAIMSIDGSGEFTSTLFAEGLNGHIRKIHEIINPDSLGLFYSTITEYCGFRRNDGEFKLMGMSPFGDPQKFDISAVIKWDRHGYTCNEKYIWAHGHNRYMGRRFSKKMVEMWGPPREDEGLSEPYIHIAAAAQFALEQSVLSLLDTYLGDVLQRHQGRLCLVGGCALNVRMNRKIMQHPKVKQIWVQPAANDSGTSVGAATWVAQELGEKVEPMLHVYYGPEFSNDQIALALDKYKIKARKLEDPVDKASELLARGEILAWFQGAMEFGPRALGNRSILAHPAIEGMSDQINERIKFREKWRPFCPSILDTHAPEILNSKHESPFMTFSFKVDEDWKGKIPEVVHVDGTARPQIVSEELNPTYYRLLSHFFRSTGFPCLINTSLNRRGEPIVCTPEDALAMFFGSGLEHMIMGDFLIQK